MNSSYLSYNPNDFFWVSVKDNFDFKVCNQIDETKPSPTPIKNSLSRATIKDLSCNCPSQSPCPSKTEIPTQTQNKILPKQLIKTSSINNVKLDEYTKQVCKNYNKSKQLTQMQNDTSASQRYFSDTDKHYSKLIRQTLNVSIGIIAIVVTIGFS